jgi:hypothetical protein
MKKMVFDPYIFKIENSNLTPLALSNDKNCIAKHFLNIIAKLPRLVYFDGYRHGLKDTQTVIWPLVKFFLVINLDNIYFACINVLK